MRMLPLIGYLAVLLLIQTANAHPGNTAADGCHYCRTNCDKWGEAWGERHCHGGYSDHDSYDSYSPPKPKDYCSVQGLYESYISKKSQGEDMANLGGKSWWYLCPKDNRQKVYEKINSTFQNEKFFSPLPSQPPAPSWWTEEQKNKKTTERVPLANPIFRKDLSAELACQKIANAKWNYFSDNCICNSGYIPNSLGSACVLGK